MTLDGLRAFAVSRSLFAPVGLQRALETLGFVQADPIRAPARAQDLTLRHGATRYHAGDLERRYERLAIEEDFFVNYGFVSRAVQALMHPRRPPPAWPAGPRTRVHQLLAFVREHGEVHPRDVDAHFSHGTVTNHWGGSSNATTHLLEDFHYRGWLRVVRRERGIRVYALREQDDAGMTPPPGARLDALVDVVVNIYAPIPAASLPFVLRRLRYAAPQLRSGIDAAVARARARLSHQRVDGTEWYWPADERPRRQGADDRVRLLAPFDPIVWDRRRFERFWGWPYRFEAYTPVSRRRFGYYALPLLWREQVLGWANLSVAHGALRAEVGYVAGRPPEDPAFTRELEAEIARMRYFLAGRAPSPGEAEGARIRGAAARRAPRSGGSPGRG